MSERDYWDEESFQKYREYLMQRRKELDPVTDSWHIKFIDKELEEMPDHFLESQVDIKKDQTQKDNSKKNRLRYSMVFYVLLAIPFLLFVLSSVGMILSIFDFIVDLLTKIGSGNWVIGLIIAPFAVISLIQVFRGAIFNFNADTDIFGLDDKRKDWKATLYIVINLLSYMALYIALKRI